MPGADRVPAADFVTARAANRKSRHRLLVVEPETTQVDIAPAIRASLAVTVHDLTEDVMPNNFAGNFGLRGLAKWSTAVADRRTKKLGRWARLFDSSAAHVSAMQRLYDCLTTEYSSPGAMRPLYADYLDGASELLGDPALREAGARYARAGDLWSQIAEAATGGASAPYRALVERRLELLLWVRQRGSPGTARARGGAAGVHRGPGPAGGGPDWSARRRRRAGRRGPGRRTGRVRDPRRGRAHLRQAGVSRSGRTARPGSPSAGTPSHQQLAGASANRPSRTRTRSPRLPERHEVGRGQPAGRADAVRPRG